MDSVWCRTYGVPPIPRSGFSTLMPAKERLQALQDDRLIELEE